MASIEQRGTTFRARIRRDGAPTISRSFDRREDAVIWAADTEAAVRSGTLQSHKLKRATLGELLSAYGEEVTPRKKGAKQEHSRIEALVRDPISRYSLENLSKAVFRSFRDRRLKTVTGSTFNREAALLSVTLAWAAAELDAPVAADLLDGLKEPENAARERRLQPGEQQRLVDAAPPWLADYIVLALETALRRSELVGLVWGRVDLVRRVATLLTSKNGLGRRVPLSGTALRVLEKMPRNIDGKLFSVHPDVVTSNFIECCRRAGIEGLRLHDLRAEAVSRLFERGLDLVSVKSISGHKSPIIMRYMRAGDTEALAARLA